MSAAPEDTPCDSTAAALALESELERVIGGFAQEHGRLIRQACRVSDSVSDLVPVVVTTLLGHAVVRLSRLSGRAHVERVMTVLLDQLERVDEAAERAKTRRETVH